MPNTEDIEAKLCAYVDGELDEAGRVEIERHLTTNPQHRKLIEELVEQRDLLRALPRARAPLDVAEMLNAQLERAALLNEADDWRDQPIRLSRWPQIRAAAAVLLLVFGLAAVVYYVVPSPTRTNAPIVFNAPAPVERPRSEEVPEPPRTPSELVSGSVVTVGRGEPDKDFMKSTEQQVRAMASLFPDTMGDTPISNAASPQLDILRNAFAAAEPKRAAVKVIVAAADADDAQQRVREYFDERGVELEPQFAQAPMPQPLSIDLTQRALGARQQQPTQVTLPERAKESKDDLPAPPGAELDAAPAEPAPERATGAAPDPADQPAQEQTFVTRLPRSEVAALCQGISNQFAGRTAQVLEETPSDARQPTESPDFAPVEIGNWNSLFPWLAKSQAADAPHERRFALAPTTQPSADEEVDVLIVVRTDPALQLQQAQQALTDTEASGAARAEQPATAPATAPSSQ